MILSDTRINDLIAAGIITPNTGQLQVGRNSVDVTLGNIIYRTDQNMEERYYPRLLDPTSSNAASLLTEDGSRMFEKLDIEGYQDTYYTYEKLTTEPSYANYESPNHAQAESSATVDGYILHPNHFILGSVQEKFDITKALWLTEDGGLVTDQVLNESFWDADQELVPEKANFSPLGAFPEPESSGVWKPKDWRWKHEGSLPVEITQMYEGRSTTGRIGLVSHLTAGVGDVGFDGSFTLEIVNNSPWSIVLRPGMRIGQVIFNVVLGHCTEYYQGYDQTDTLPQLPRLGPGRF